MDSFSFNENLPSPSTPNPTTETKFRRGFDVFTFSSKDCSENSSETEMKMYGILMDDYLKHEKVPDRNSFLSLFSPIPSPLKSPEVASQVFSYGETESSSLQGGSQPECLSESDYLPGGPENEDSGAEEESEPNKRKVSTDKSSVGSQTAQNKMKNHQGTIAGKIKKSCKRDRKTGKNTRLFEEATKDLTPDKTERFRRWAMNFEKTYRTWNRLKEFLSTNPEFGIIFANMAILLLSEAFKIEYEECINKGKLGEKSKALLREQNSKDFYIEKFSLIIDMLEGNANDFDSEIKKHRKSLKKG